MGELARIVWVPPPEDAAVGEAEDPIHGLAACTIDSPAL
jgi:hypothetical protein